MTTSRYLHQNIPHSGYKIVHYTSLWFRQNLELRLGLPPKSEINEPIGSRYNKKITRPVNGSLFTSYAL